MTTTQKLSPAQKRTMDLIATHGVVTYSWANSTSGAPRGFSISAAEALGRKGLVVTTEDADARVFRFTLA